jgi:hypothetical protein
MKMNSPPTQPSSKINSLETVDRVIKFDTVSHAIRNKCRDALTLCCLQVCGRIVKLLRITRGPSYLSRFSAFVIAASRASCSFASTIFRARCWRSGLSLTGGGGAVFSLCLCRAQDLNRRQPGPNIASRLKSWIGEWRLRTIAALSPSYDPSRPEHQHWRERHDHPSSSVRRDSVQRGRPC